MSEPLRDQILAKLIQAFGEPAKVPAPDGMLYRWVLKARTGETLRLTLDSPEFPDMAHLIFSDPTAVQRVTSINMRSLAEAERVIAEISRRLPESAA